MTSTLNTFIASGNTPPWLPREVAEGRRFAWWAQIMFLLAALIWFIIAIVEMTYFAIDGGAGRLAFGLFGFFALVICFLSSVFLKKTVLDAVDQGRFHDAKNDSIVWIIIGFFGFGVWSHHMFAAGMGPVADAAFAIGTMLIAIPTGVKIFNWLATLWGGALRTTTAMHFALGLVGLFTIGGLSGIMHASPPVDLQQTDTYFVVAHLHYVLIGGSLFGLFAGVYYWWPKITGRLLDERLGKLGFWLSFVAFNVAFFPQHYLGAVGMPRRIYTYAAGTGWGFWNLVSTVGAFGIGLGVLVFLANAWRSLRAGAPAARIASRFHGTVAEAAVGTCVAIRETEGLGDVALSGGVFQNRLLLEGMNASLGRAGFKVLMHTKLPCNDGCISLGQAVIGREALKKR